MASNPKVPAFVFAQAARDAHTLSVSTLKETRKSSKLLDNVGAKNFEALATRDLEAFNAGRGSLAYEMLMFLPNPADGNPLKKMETKKKE